MFVSFKCLFFMFYVIKSFSQDKMKYTEADRATVLIILKLLPIKNHHIVFYVAALSHILCFFV